MSGGFNESVFAIASLQGQLSHAIFSIHVVNPDFLQYYLGFDPGSLLFLNMLYGNGMHIYSRPAMKKLRVNYRVLFSMYGSFIFNYSSTLVFFWIREAYMEERRFGGVISFFLAKFMYSIFYSYLYFVDRSSDSNARRDSTLDHMFDEE